MNLLLHKTGETNKFIQRDANKALDAMVDRVTPLKCVTVLISEGLVYGSDSNRRTIDSETKLNAKFSLQAQESASPGLDVPPPGQLRRGHRRPQSPHEQGTHGPDRPVHRPTHRRRQPRSQVSSRRRLPPRDFADFRTVFAIFLADSTPSGPFGR